MTMDYNAYNMTKLDAAASAASRQKSCNACVRGKRRCDKRTPRCTRCAAKGLDCVYQKMPPPPASTTGSTTPEMADVPDFDMSFDIESMGTETSPESQTHHTGPPEVTTAAASLGLGPGLDFDIVDFMNGASSDGTGSLFNFNTAFTTENKMTLPPLTQAPPAPVRDLSLLKRDQCCVTVNELEVHDPRHWAGYTMKEMKGLPMTFAKTRQTSFMHQRLWSGGKLPKTILAVFSAATAYANCSPENKGWVMKLLSDTAITIHREGELATTIPEKLARVQAVMILDTMRMLDGDIALRAAAEREAHVQVAWIKELGELKHQLETEAKTWGNGSMHNRDHPPKTWDGWVLLESIRRTTLASCAFLCLTMLLKGEEPLDEVWVNMGFTASKHLWEAKSSVEFYRAWREKPQYFIDCFDFKDFWAYGRVEDLDDFTRLMLTPQVGVEAVEHFMAGDVAIPVNDFS